MKIGDDALRPRKRGSRETTELQGTEKPSGIKRTRVVLGDIFSIDCENDRVRYFQYICDDRTELNSQVIRVFKMGYSRYSEITLSELTNEDVDFHVHCVIQWGIKMGAWKKCGNSKNIGATDIYFRSTNDDHKLNLCKRWWVWKTNEPKHYVGRLRKGDDVKYQIGLIVSPIFIVSRVHTGSYNFVFPSAG